MPVGNHSAPCKLVSTSTYLAWTPRPWRTQRIRPVPIRKPPAAIYDRDITRRFAKHNARFRYIRVSIEGRRIERGPGADSAITDKGDKPLRDIALVDVEYKEAAESGTGTRADSQGNQETTATTA
jgi:hypothetical protein